MSIATPRSIECSTPSFWCPHSVPATNESLAAYAGREMQTVMMHRGSCPRNCGQVVAKPVQLVAGRKSSPTLSNLDRLPSGLSRPSSKGTHPPCVPRRFGGRALGDDLSDVSCPARSRISSAISIASDRTSYSIGMLDALRIDRRIFESDKSR